MNKYDAATCTVVSAVEHAKLYFGTWNASNDFTIMFIIIFYFLVCARYFGIVY